MSRNPCHPHQDALDYQRHVVQDGSDVMFAYDVPCPKCLVGSHSPCYTIEGRIAAHPHTARLNNARSAISGESFIPEFDEYE